MGNNFPSCYFIPSLTNKIWNIKNKLSVSYVNIMMMMINLSWEAQGWLSGSDPCLWISKGPRRDWRSFPTKAGNLQGRCQALMHGLTTIIFLANCPLLFLATDVTNVEKFSPSPGIEPETFCNLGRCSNHWATRLGQINREVQCGMHCLLVTTQPGQSSQLDKTVDTMINLSWEAQGWL